MIRGRDLMKFKGPILAGIGMFVLVKLLSDIPFVANCFGLRGSGFEFFDVIQLLSKNNNNKSH